MTSLNWQDSGSSVPSLDSARDKLRTSEVGSLSYANPWFAISMGLLGLILGFALHRFFIPETLGAQVPQQPTAQAVVVQPSPTKPLPSVGGGCGCGGGGSCGAALAPNPPTT